MWAIPYLMLRTPTVVASLSRAAFLGITSRLATHVVDHPRLIVGVLASTCIVVGVIVPRRPLIRTLRVEVLLFISLSLDFTLFIEIAVHFLHRPFHIHRSVI